MLTIFLLNLLCPLNLHVFSRVAKNKLGKECITYPERLVPWHKRFDLECMFSELPQVDTSAQINNCSSSSFSLKDLYSFSKKREERTTTASNCYLHSKLVYFAIVLR